jgi:hypothetical protein
VGTQGAQVGFEGRFERVQPAGVDNPVVGQRHRRDSALSDTGQHHRPHQISGALPWGRLQAGQIAGMVIKGAGDGHGRTVGQPPLGPIRLPALIRAGETKPRVRRYRPLLRLGHDHPVTGQNPPHRRPRRHRMTLTGQRPHNRLRPVIEAQLDEPFAGSQHHFLNTSSGLPRRMMRPPRAFLQPRQPLFTKPTPPLVERLATDLLAAAKRRHILDLPGQRRRGTNIHRRHLLGHGPSWPKPYSGVSDVPRHTTVSDVPKPDSALRAG